MNPDEAEINLRRIPGEARGNPGRIRRVLGGVEGVSGDNGAGVFNDN